MAPSNKIAAFYVQEFSKMFPGAPLEWILELPDMPGGEAELSEDPFLGVIISIKDPEDQRVIYKACQKTGGGLNRPPSGPIEVTNSEFLGKIVSMRDKEGNLIFRTCERRYTEGAGAAYEKRKAMELQRQDIELKVQAAFEKSGIAKTFRGTAAKTDGYKKPPVSKRDKKAPVSKKRLNKKSLAKTPRKTPGFK